MFKKSLALLSVILLSCSAIVFAVGNQAPPASIAKSAPSTSIKFSEELLKNKLTSLLGLEVKSVAKTPMPGLAEVVTNQGLFYTSFDGKYLIQGKLFGLGQTVSNLTEESLAKVRVTGLSEFENDMIVYPAKNERHVVSVFTDITCGYCRKMHEQMDEYNDLGITVRYLAYPRAGVTDRAGGLTAGFKDLRSVWCHEDPATALTKAKMGSNVAQRICDKPVKEEFDFGRQVGVNSTPTIITSNGMMMPGYRKPQDLLQILESM